VAEHGTRANYVAGCRCDSCGLASRRYHAERREVARYQRVRRGDRMIAPGLRPEQHGRMSTYTNLGCRCEKCRASMTEYERARRRRVATDA
jgi:hypothetical protein